MTAKADKAQIGILVSPQGNNVYRVALAYGKRVSHDKVQQEIAALVQNTHGNLLAQPVITDDSLNPSDLKRFPVTTGVLLVLNYAPLGAQTYQSLPVYLEAFRSEKHLQIIFANAGEGGETKPQEFASPELKVTLTRTQGAERYEATILSEKGTLPVPLFTVSQNRVQEIPQAAANKPAQTTSGGFGRILLVLLGSIGAGAAIYLIASRLVLTPKSAQ